KGCRMEDITQLMNLSFCPGNVKNAKKTDVDHLLKQIFSDEWRNIPQHKHC
ncbi:hypothetical protein L9F63_023760, partial [Diploptera punctata]